MISHPEQKKGYYWQYWQIALTSLHPVFHGEIFTVSIGLSNPTVCDTLPLKALQLVNLLISPAPDISMPKRESQIRIRCQTNTNIRVQVEPSESMQLVALVPQVNNDSTLITDVSTYEIRHRLYFHSVSCKTFTAGCRSPQAAPLNWSIFVRVYVTFSGTRSLH